MREWLTIGLVLLSSASVCLAEDLGTLSAHPFDADSTSNPFGKGWSIEGR